MRTSGVFPVAMVAGGQGVAKGLDGTPPSPLAPLPSIQVGHAEGAVIGGDVAAGGDFAGRDINKVEGNQFNAAGDVNIEHMGDKVEMGSGDYVKGDKNIHGDVVQGDKVMGDKVEGDSISVGNISGSQGIAIGRGAKAEVNIQQGMPADQLNQLFAPLLEKVGGNETAVSNLEALKAEAGKGEEANDEKMAGLIEDIADAAPSVVEGIVNLFTNSIIAKAAGGATKYVLKRIRK